MSPGDWIALVGLVAIPIAIVAWRKAGAEKETNRIEHIGLQNLCTNIERELHRYQLDAAQRFATVIQVQDLERRLMTAIERFEEKLDRHLERDKR